MDLFFLILNLLLIFAYIILIYKKRRTSRICDKTIVFWIIAIIGGLIFAIAWLIITGNGSEDFTDIVYENVASIGSNKSPERALIYVLIFLGIIAYSVYFMLCVTKSTDKIDYSLSAHERFAFIFSVMIGCYCIFYVDLPFLFIITTLIVLLNYIYKTSIIESCLFYVFGIYALLGIYRVYVWMGGNLNASFEMLAISMFFILIFVTCGVRAGVEKFRKGILICQCLIPATLLVNLQNQYIMGEKQITVDVPFKVQIFFSIIIILFILEAIFMMRKKWIVPNNIQECISFGSLVSVMAFNTSINTGAIMSSDLHHTFENVIGFSQIFEKGLMPYRDYIPVSGLYSVAQGAIFNIVGNGVFANANIAETIFFFIIDILVLLLLYIQLDKRWIFFIITIFPLSGYNRVSLSLPIILLLLYPPLLAKKNLWLKVWFLTSFLNGLYYPTYGAAICLGFLPLGIWQIYQFAKGELKEQIKRISFWIYWGLCFLPVVLSIKVLWGTYKHVKAMADQTIMADGIARFGQNIPDYFMPYLSDLFGVRVAFYYGLTFLIPALFVWVTFAVCVKLSGMHTYNKKIRFTNKKLGLMALPLVIVPCVIYSFTFVRLDQGEIFNRSAYGLYLLTVVLILLTVNYIIDSKLQVAIISFAVAIPAIGGNFAISKIDEKLEACYSVPDNYIFIEDDEHSLIGTGFIESSIYYSIKEAYQKWGNSKEYYHFGTLPSFGYYYLCDLKPISTIEIGLTVKGYEAAKESIELLRNHRTIVGGKGDAFSESYAFRNYYLYYYLMTSGEYVWSDDKQGFVPNEVGLSRIDIKKKHENLSLIPEDFSIGLAGSSLGASIKSMHDIFLEYPNNNLQYSFKQDEMTINFTDPIDGNEVDHIYVEFDNMDQYYEYTYTPYLSEELQEKDSFNNLFKRKNYNMGVEVIIQWEDNNNQNHRLRCDMGKGKLLIPLGAGLNWLCNDHNQVTIWVEKNGIRISMPNVVQIQLMKVREVD